jgi:hypothetical protein
MAINSLPEIPQDLPQTRAAAQSLLDKLSNANPTNAADSQTISDAIDAVNAILTQLNQEDMLSRDGAMQAAAAEIKAPLKKLTDLKSQLADIATRIETLGTVAQDVDSVLGWCKSVFKI